MPHLDLDGIKRPNRRTIDALFRQLYQEYSYEYGPAAAAYRLHNDLDNELEKLTKELLNSPRYRKLQSARNRASAKYRDLVKKVKDKIRAVKLRYLSEGLT